MTSAWSRLCLVGLTAAVCGRVQGGDGPGDAPVGPGDGSGSGTGSDPPVLELLARNIGGPGSVDDTGVAARLSFPQGVVLDSAGNLYVSNTGNDTIRKATPTGVVTTLAGTAGTMGSADGTGTAALLSNPRTIVIDSASNLFIADSGNRTIRKNERRS